METISTSELSTDLELSTTLTVRFLCCRFGLCVGRLEMVISGKTTAAAQVRLDPFFLRLWLSATSLLAVTSSSLTLGRTSGEFSAEVWPGVDGDEEISGDVLLQETFLALPVGVVTILPLLLDLAYEMQINDY